MLKRSILFVSVAALAALSLSGGTAGDSRITHAFLATGGATFAQDESTSVVYGMPQAALACGAARSQLALEQVAPAILSLCRKGTSK